MPSSLLVDLAYLYENLLDQFLVVGGDQVFHCRVDVGFLRGVAYFRGVSLFGGRRSWSRSLCWPLPECSR